MTTTARGLLTLAAVIVLVIGCQRGLTTPEPTASPSVAPGVASEIITPGVLTVCSDLRLPPQDIFLDGQPMGSDIDLARELTDRLGLRLNVLNTPRSSIGQSLGSGRCDIAISALRSASADAAGMMLIPYLRVRQSLLIARSRAGTITGPQDLCGRTIEVMEGSEEEAVLAGTGSHSGRGLSAACAQAGKRPIVVAAGKSDTDAAQSVIHGGADGFFVDSALAGWELATWSDELTRVDGVTSLVEDEGIAVADGKDGLRASLTQALAALRDDGTYGRILAKWSIAN